MTSQSARPPPLVLMIYAAGGGGYGDYLLASGFRVEEAHTGPLGVNRAATLLPDLIVLDFGLDGDTVAQLRREPTTSGIPIIALTELTTRHARRTGADSVPRPSES
jgi:DNA-binding response OmpR family regulator